MPSLEIEEVLANELMHASESLDEIAVSLDGGDE
jgi:hypothetical protein